MSIRKLFKNPVDSVNVQSGSTEVESRDFVLSRNERQDLFLPHVNFASASSFVKYGSAYEYYNSSFKRIYNTYPYDGSEREKIIYELSSSYLDKWIFDYNYPKSTGYINLSYDGWGTAASITSGFGLPNSSDDYEYIFIRGGLHTASSDITNEKLWTKFKDHIKYDTNNKRTTTFKTDLSDGITVEFWLKKAAFDTSKTEKEVILDLWNGNATTAADYGRFILLIDGAASANTFKISFYSGSVGVNEQVISTSDITNSSLTSWNHYAVSLVSSSSGLVSRFYVNGLLNQSSSLSPGGAIKEVGGLINGYIGALQTRTKAVNVSAFAGKLSASMDEFRFWKTRRSSKLIYNNFYKHVGGGTNTDISNTDLGVYYKFNEGITGVDSIDSTVLDYSGRIANGTWNGYSAGSRNTGSAFMSSSLSTKEVEDPIIYKEHPDVISKLSELQKTGLMYDRNNSNYLYNTIPSWMREEDEESNSNVKFLYQIISSHLDTLHAQITALPKLKNKTYPSASHKALPFADRLIEERGLVAPNIFSNVTLFERYGDRDINATLYEKEVNEIKNLIYTNIYNNIEHIYKAKGTESSVRNLLRCFGIDDEIVKLNVYTDGGKHYFHDKIKQTSLNKKYINFNKEQYFNSSVYQTSSTINSLTYISGSGLNYEKYSAFTVETDIIVPRDLESMDKGHIIKTFVSSSCFGVHEATTASGVEPYTWPSAEIANFQIYLVRDKRSSDNAKFVIKNQDGSINLQTELYHDIYDNQRWTLAVRVKPENYPLAGNVVTSSAPTYKLEFYGVHHAFDTVQHEFTLTASLDNTSGSAYLTRPKRLYAGAHRQNFTGTVLQRSDIQLGSARFYFDYLTDSELKQHNLDAENYGTFQIHGNSTIFADQLPNIHIPRSELLALNWEFQTVTGSDSSGNFIIDDVSSGSTDTRYGWIDNVVRREHRGRGIGFGNAKTSFLFNNFIYNSKKELPEISFTSNNIFIKGDKEEHFVIDDDVSDNFYILEKSMSQAISEEMINMFATIRDFSNLVGKATERYRENYKGLNFLRKLFFENIESTSLDFDRFYEYFKWIDNSISSAVKQMFPLSARFGDEIVDVIESHILERNKYPNKFPLIKDLDIGQRPIRGVNEALYTWKFGHAPIVSDDNKHCLWQKERKERTEIPETQIINDVILSHNSASADVFSKEDRTTYKGSTYALRKLAKPYNLSQAVQSAIHGGTNYRLQKDRNFIFNATHIHGKTTSIGIPVNVVVVGVGEGTGLTEQSACKDVIDPSIHEEYCIKAYVGKFSGEPVTDPLNEDSSYFYGISARQLPLNVVSESVTTGYNQIVNEGYTSQAVFANLHSDTTYRTNDIPMQGPFTQNWVGGHQHRHVDLNRYSANRISDETGLPTENNLDDQYTRKESWRIRFTDRFDGAFGFVGPDYGGPYPDINRKYAIYFRDEHFKRPLNIKNIQTRTGSGGFFDLGNFTQNYEVVHTFGRLENNFYFRKNEDWRNYLTPYIHDRLPQTTNTIALWTCEPRIVSGNVHGTQFSSMKPDNNNFTSTTTITNSFVGGTASSGGGFKAKGYNVVGWADKTGSNDAFWKFDPVPAGPTSSFFHAQTGVAPTDVLPNVYFHTGSDKTHTAYWNNINSELNKWLYDYTTTHTVHTESLSQGLTSAPTNPAVLNYLEAPVERFGSAIFQQLYNAHPSGAPTSVDYAASFWLNIADTPESYQGTRRTIYAFSGRGIDAGPGDCGIQLVAELALTGTNGDLTYFEYRNAKGLSGDGCICVFTASLDGYESTIAPANPASTKMATYAPNAPSGWVHVGVHRRHKFTYGAGGAASVDFVVDFYINGTLHQEVSLTKHEATATGFTSGDEACNVEIAQTIAPRHVFLLNNTSSTTVNPELTKDIHNSAFYGKIDEFCFWSGYDSDLANRLYDFGYKLNVTGCYMADETDKRIAWFQFDDSTVGNGNVFLDSMGLKNHLTMSAATPSFYTKEDSVLEEPFAQYSIVADNVGSVYNATLSHVSPACHNTWFDFTDLTGGQNQDEVTSSVTVTDKFIDIVTAVPCGCPDTDVVKFKEKQKIRITDPGPGEDAEIIVTKTSINITGSHNSGNPNRVQNTVISSRFSSPGGPEVQTLGYLDVYSREYSVYNALPYRNLTVRGTSSGEPHADMMVEDHLGLRFGHLHHLRERSGRFGADRRLGTISEANYLDKPSFYKIQRNIQWHILSSSNLPDQGANPTPFRYEFDNSFVTRPIPQSDYQYTWISGSLKGNLDPHNTDARYQAVQIGYFPMDGTFELLGQYLGLTGFDAAEPWYLPSSPNIDRITITLNNVPVEGDKLRITNPNQTGVTFEYTDAASDPPSCRTSGLNSCPANTRIDVSSTPSVNVTRLASAINSSILQWSASADTSNNKVILQAPYINPEFAMEVARFPVGTSGVNSWTYEYRKSQSMTISAVRFPRTANDFVGQTD